MARRAQRNWGSVMITDNLMFTTRRYVRTLARPPSHGVNGFHSKRKHTR